jgi:hypothetical protein
MIVGADVNAIVTPAMIHQATAQTGQPIQFWGRYFKDSGNPSPEQYQADAEASLFNQSGIRVLPTGRQTGHVGGTQHQGQTDGKTNANAIVDAFGAHVLAGLQSGLLVFLDVEGPPHASLSADYYAGWSDSLIQTAGALGAVLLPGVYGAEGDNTTWVQLAQAVANGASCDGTWIARPGTIGCHPLHPYNEAHVRPPALPASIKILVWQCVQECNNLDFNLLNPAFEAGTLAKFVLPEVPPQAVV